MTKAIQTAYYHKALNPSDYSTLLQLAVEIGLDADLFTRRLHFLFHALIHP